MKTIGVIGTAKNTGKTTTLSFLLNYFISQGQKVAVTGIGYDGEELDNITNLPKPRLHFEKGSVLATSEKCLYNTDASFEIIAETSFSTALGKIILVRIIKSGQVVIAGPNKVKSLIEILKIIKDESGSDIVLIDGSLNRLSPMYILDKLILTTGASRNTNIDDLVKEIQLFEKLFSYGINHSNIFDENKIIVFNSSDSKIVETNTLIDENDFQLLIKELSNNVQKIYFGGIISTEYLTKNLDRLLKIFTERIEIVFKSPIQLLLTDNFIMLNQLLSLFERHEVKISYRYKPELSAVTINPFYPKHDNFRYIPSYLDKDILIKSMKDYLNTHVFNILESDSKKIFELL